jgi:molybdopterin converting factor small subunit
MGLRLLERVNPCCASAAAAEHLILQELLGSVTMAVKVMIPTPLRVYAGKKQSTEVKAGSVGDALMQLTTEFAELKKHLFTEDGQLRSFVNVYLNDEDIRYLAKDKTITKDGDTVSIVPSIAGGC